jgi:hypothetical protein
VPARSLSAIQSRYEHASITCMSMVKRNEDYSDTMIDETGWPGPGVLKDSCSSFAKAMCLHSGRCLSGPSHATAMRFICLRGVASSMCLMSATLIRSERAFITSAHPLAAV